MWVLQWSTIKNGRNAFESFWHWVVGGALFFSKNTPISSLVVGQTSMCTYTYIVLAQNFYAVMSCASIFEIAQLEELENPKHYTNHVFWPHTPRQSWDSTMPKRGDFVEPQDYGGWAALGLKHHVVAYTRQQESTPQKVNNVLLYWWYNTQCNAKHLNIFL